MTDPFREWAGTVTTRVVVSEGSGPNRAVACNRPARLGRTLRYTLLRCDGVGLNS